VTINRARARRLSLALFPALLGLSCALAGSLASAQSPTPGGEVPSMLALSLSEPGPLKRVGNARGGGAFATTIRVEATATDVPSRLSLADGDSGPGVRRGYLGRSRSILSTPLEASADGGPLRSLADPVPAPLRTWRVPTAGAPARIRVVQKASSARAVRNRNKLLLVTLTAGGP